MEQGRAPHGGPQSLSEWNMHAETRHRSIPAIPVRKLLCTSAGGTSNGNTLSGSRNNLSGKRLATMAPTSCRLNWCPSSATGWGSAVYRACARCIARPCRPSSLFWRRLAGAPIRIGWLPDVSRRARAAPRSPATVMCWISRGRCLVSWGRIAPPGRPPRLPLASSNPGALREVVCPAATNVTVSKAVITRRRGCAIQYGICALERYWGQVTPLLDQVRELPAGTLVASWSVRD